MEGGGKDKEITGDRSKGWWRVSKIKGRMDDENKWMEGNGGERESEEEDGEQA